MTSNVFGTLFLVATFRILVLRWSNLIQSLKLFETLLKRQKKTRTKNIHGHIWNSKKERFQEKDFINWKITELADFWCLDSVFLPLRWFLSCRLNARTKLQLIQVLVNHYESTLYLKMSPCDTYDGTWQAIFHTRILDWVPYGATVIGSSKSYRCGWRPAGRVRCPMGQRGSTSICPSRADPTRASKCKGQIRILNVIITITGASTQIQ
jgi:hypothetical protein